MEQRALIRINVKSVICETLTLETITNEEDLIDSGLIDSLSLINLMVMLEEEFNIRIEPDDLNIEDYRSVLSISEMVLRLSLTASLPIQANT